MLQNNESWRAEKNYINESGAMLVKIQQQKCSEFESKWFREVGEIFSALPHAYDSFYEFSRFFSLIVVVVVDRMA